MRAAFFERTGPAEVVTVGELPTPTPAAGQVRVRVRAAALNPVDAYLRAGLVSMPLSFPFITGSDFAGDIDAIGDGVTDFAVGDRVWGSNQGLLGRPGTFAEWVCPDAHFCYPLPDSVDYETAAACALTGITAHLGLFHRTELKSGEMVFVNGGAGGVGSMVVRMSKIVGAKVICTVGSDANAEVARSLGADKIINYKIDDITAEVKSYTSGKGVSVYYETQPPTDLMAIIDRLSFRGADCHDGWSRGDAYTAEWSVLCQGTTTDRIRDVQRAPRAATGCGRRSEPLDGVERAKTGHRRAVPVERSSLGPRFATAKYAWQSGYAARQDCPRSGWLNQRRPV